jgi:methionyl-tRNA formyltransferase
MKIVFFGTPDYVLPVLEELHKKIKAKLGSPIAGVVTQSPKPVGRGKIVTFSPIDAWAHQRKIPIFYKSSDLLKEKPAADIGVLAAYGEIIPEAVIKNFKYGIINLHPSLLPQFRGASPVQAAIATGETQTGVTIIKLDPKLDHGAILSQFKEDIESGDTTDSLRAKLFERGAEVLVELIEPFVKGKITPRAQDDKTATHTTQVKKADGFIPPKFLKAALEGKTLKEDLLIPFIKDFSIKPSPDGLDNFIRSLHSWPGAWSYIKISDRLSKRIKIIKAELDEGKLVLIEVQLEGKNTVSWKEFLAGYPSAAFAAA